MMNDEQRFPPPGHIDEPPAYSFTGGIFACAFGWLILLFWAWLFGILSP